MIIKGSFDALKIHESFDMYDENGASVFNVTRNNYMPNKIFIKNPSNDVEYIGELVDTIDVEEYILYENHSEILRIDQTKLLGMPKFEIISPFGDFTVKFSLIKKSLIMLEGTKEILVFTGTPAHYTLDIDDNCNAFYVMSAAYGITLLLNT